MLSTEHLLRYAAVPVTLLKLLTGTAPPQAPPPMTIIYILGHLSLYLFILYLKLPEGQHKNNNNNNTGFPVLSSIITVCQLCV